LLGTVRPLRVIVLNMVSVLKRSATLSLFLFALSAQGAGTFFCCPDPNSGRRTCGDTLPEVCRGKAYKVISGDGTVLKEVGPPLTAEQKAEAAVLAKRKQEQDELAREQRRKDQALLDTYSSVKDIDVAQQQAESDLQHAIASANAQIDVIRDKRKRYEREAEFYKKKTVPPDIAKELRDADYSIKLLEETREVKRRDFQTIKEKYDSDRRRYLEITSRPTPR
jgi:hypothetical protein